MNDITRKLMKGFLSKIEPCKPSPLLSAALRGESDSYIVRQTVKRLDAELKETGSDTFTLGDLRRIQREMFEGSSNPTNNS